MLLFSAHFSTDQSHSIVMIELRFFKIVVAGFHLRNVVEIHKNVKRFHRWKLENLYFGAADRPLKEYNLLHPRKQQHSTLDGSARAYSLLGTAWSRDSALPLCAKIQNLTKSAQESPESFIYPHQNIFYHSTLPD